MEQVLDIPALIQPISADNPAGEDMSFSEEFDQIKEARRADDDLPQEEWETKLKASEWPKVTRIATELLSSKTKDLQIAAWLTEAVTNTRGFTRPVRRPDLVPRAAVPRSGTRSTRAWTTGSPCGPARSRGSMPRCRRSSQSIPLTSLRRAALHCGTGTRLPRWTTSRARTRRPPSAWSKRRTRPPARSSARQSPPLRTASTLPCTPTSSACQEAVKALDVLVDEKFGKEAPSLAVLRKAVDDCAKVVRSGREGQRNRNAWTRRPRRASRIRGSGERPRASGLRRPAGLARRRAAEADGGGGVLPNQRAA